jgi:transcriptional regulator with XRE-family HTH domain
MRLTNRDVAKKLGVTEGHVSRVLNGRYPSSKRFREQICTMLERPERDLFLPEDPSRGVTVSSSRAGASVDVVDLEDRRHA